MKFSDVPSHQIAYVSNDQFAIQQAFKDCYCEKGSLWSEQRYGYGNGTFMIEFLKYLDSGIPVLARFEFPVKL